MMTWRSYTDEGRDIGKPISHQCSLKVSDKRVHQPNKHPESAEMAPTQPSQLQRDVYELDHPRSILGRNLPLPKPDLEQVKQPVPNVVTLKMNNIPNINKIQNTEPPKEEKVIKKRVRNRYGSDPSHMGFKKTYQMNPETGRANQLFTCLKCDISTPKICNMI